MDRILITGGSGFVGSRLLRQLLDQHPAVELHNLDLVPAPLPVINHVASVEDPKTYETLPPVDAVVHLAAVSREPGYPTRRYYEVNTEGTRLLAYWAARNGVRTFLLYSSVAVYGTREEPTDEQGMPAPQTAYGMSKLLAEQAAREVLAPAGIPLTVLRPGVIFGPGDDGNFARLARAIRQGWFVFPGRVDTRKASVFLDDVVHLTHWLLEQPAPPSVINAVYTPAPTIIEIGDAIAAALGKTPRRLMVPQSLARLGVGTLGLLEAGKPVVQRTFHSRRVDKLVESTNVISTVLPTLPYSFPHDLSQAICAWLSSDHPPVRYRRATSRETSTARRSRQQLDGHVNSSR